MLWREFEYQMDTALKSKAAALLPGPPAGGRERPGASSLERTYALFPVSLQTELRYHLSVLTASLFHSKHAVPSFITTLILHECDHEFILSLSSAVTA